MTRRFKTRRSNDHPARRWTLLALGVILLLVSPLIGAIPGPGGLFAAGLGIALTVKSSSRAKRHYVRFKRSQPVVGRWTDRALQRRSAKRKEERRKLAQASAGN